MKTINKKDDSNMLMSSREFRKLAKLNFPGGLLLSKLVIHLLRFDKLNKMHVEYEGPGGLHFIRYASKTLGFNYDINVEELENIPKEGAFVTISNHPYGGADGIGLLKSMLPLRPRFKTLSNFMMSRLKHMTQNFIALDPFVEGSGSSVNFSGIKEALKHLQSGEPLGIFPAGEVASYNKDYKGITDKKWNRSVMRMIQKAEVPVIPVYYHGTNSKMFHFLGRIHPMLRTAKIPSELLNKRKTVIKMTIGKEIDVETQKKYKNINDYIAYIREKTYELKDGAPPADTNKRENEEIAVREEIAPEPDRELLLKEIEALRCDDKVILEKDAYEVFCTYSSSIPTLMFEIGRQREITFRKVGEGSNKSLDLDEFDKTYKQLIMWDSSKEQLVGAYRIGDGNELVFSKGLEGFYTSTLFDYAPEMKDMLSNSIELGRSFVVEEYQRKALPLFMLWAGIFNYTKQYAHCRYLIGSVSITNDMSTVEKDKIVSLIKQHYSIPELSKMVKPRIPYNPDKYYIFNDKVEQRKVKMPVLMKKYLGINGKIIDFNVDPDFNLTLDGLLVVDLNEIPESFVRRFNCTGKSEERLEKSYAQALV